MSIGFFDVRPTAQNLLRLFIINPNFDRSEKRETHRYRQRHHIEKIESIKIEK